MLALETLSEKTCLLVEDRPEYRQHLSACLEEAYPGLRVLVATSVAESQAVLHDFHKSQDQTELAFALIDIGLPDGSGLDILSRLALEAPHTLGVVVTMFHEDNYLFEAMSRGAFGYLLKDENKATLVESLRRLGRNEPPISPSIARRLLAHFRKPSLSTPEKNLLTPRERQTLTLLVRGLTVSESAQEMGLSAQTVSGYVKTIYQKLHVTNRAEATREAIRRGFV